MSTALKLTASEQTDLGIHEATIERGLKTFYEVGNALLDIRDRRLYRENYKTWDEYCDKRWGMSDRHARRLIDASKVIDEIGPIGPVLPITESQVRPLTPLQPDEQRLVWEIVQQTAPNGNITAAHVKSVVQVMKDVTKTGAIDSGDGEEIKVNDLFKAVVTEETYERMKRQQAYIEEKEKKKIEREEIKRQARETLRQQIPQDTDRYKLINADLRTALADIPDDSVDLIFTDPPYDQNAIPLYGDLAQHAARILKPGGSLLTYAGHYALPEIFPLMTPHLRYWWTIALQHTGGNKRLPGKWVYVGWKPILWFVKDGRANKEFVSDYFSSSMQDNNKVAHDWQQSTAEASYYIDQLTDPGGTVLDPFLGAGTTVIAAAALDRFAIGIEIEPETFEIARGYIQDALS